MRGSAARHNNENRIGVRAPGARRRCTREVGVGAAANTDKALEHYDVVIAGGGPGGTLPNHDSFRGRRITFCEASLSVSNTLQEVPVRVAMLAVSNIHDHCLVSPGVTNAHRAGGRRCAETRR